MSIRALTATDGSVSSRMTAQFVARLARSLPIEVMLGHVLNVEQLEYKMIPDFQVEMIQQGAKKTAEALLERESRFLREQGVEVQPRLLVGEPATTLCEVAVREAMTMVVVGRRGHGDIPDLLFGSISNHVVHHCAKPVLVVKKEGAVVDPTTAPPKVRTLVAVDGSEASQRCIGFLEGLADAKDGLELVLTHVVNPDLHGLHHLTDEARFETLQALHREAETLLDTNAARLRQVGFTVETRVEEGAAGKTVCRVHQEDEFELVVMGRRGLGEVSDLLFGSVCHFVVHHCPGHVLVIS